MIKLRDDVSPSEATLEELKRYQKGIDDLQPWSARSQQAKDVFPRRNTQHNRVFREIRERITEMCNSTRRCVYCEDNMADEVEHIYPKDLFPDKCFTWENYVYACGPCNGPKNNKFAIINRTGRLVNLNPPQPAWFEQGPPRGKPAFINPRTEDPLAFCRLDLNGTFLFEVLPEIPDKDKIRASYTFETVLRFNQAAREPTRQARENAYSMYKARLFYYVKGRDAGESQGTLNNKIAGIKNECHPTVWQEMKRHHRLGKLVAIDAELDALFVAAPEALTW